MFARRLWIVLVIFITCAFNSITSSGCQEHIDRVKSFSFQDALANYDEYNLEIPLPESDGRLQTLNKKGGVSARFDLSTRKFLKYSAGKKVLDVGGAYGTTMLEALRRHPDINFDLLDLDERHLFIAAKLLARKISSDEINSKVTRNVNFLAADITEQNILESDKYDAILIARVLHYTNPTQFKTAIYNIQKSLKPGGKVFITAITPYVKRYEAFIEEYENRVAQGEEFPGYVKDLKKYINKQATTQKQRNNVANIPFMFLDTEVLKKHCQLAGLEIEEVHTMPLSYFSNSWSLDGRENVILIARKPK